MPGLAGEFQAVRQQHHVHRFFQQRQLLQLHLGRGAAAAVGARRWLGARYRAFPEGARFYTAGRVCDWLELLSFEVSEIRRYGIGFPWLQPADDGLLSATQEAWMIVARKRVLPMNWVGRVRRARVSPLVKGVPMPSARIDAGSDGDLQG